MDIPPVIRFAGNNYTGAYRDVPEILLTVEPHVPKETYDDLERILTVGTPTIFNGELSHENYNEYQQYGNHPTVAKYNAKSAKIVNKEEHIKHFMAFLLWVQRFISNLHPTPQ